LSKSISCLDQLEKSRGKIAGKLSPEEVPFKREDMSILESSVQKAQDIVTVDIPRAYRPIGRRMTWLASQGFLKDSDDLKNLGDRLKAVQTDLEEQGKQLKTRVAELRKSIGTDEAPMA
jgi:hypothetical protein